MSRFAFVRRAFLGFAVLSLPVSAAAGPLSPTKSTAKLRPVSKVAKATTTQGYPMPPSPLTQMAVSKASAASKVPAKSVTITPRDMSSGNVYAATLHALSTLAGTWPYDDGEAMKSGFYMSSSSFLLLFYPAHRASGRDVRVDCTGDFGAQTTVYAGDAYAAPNASWSYQTLSGSSRVQFLVATAGWKDAPMMISIRSQGNWRVDQCRLDLLD